MTRVSQFYKVSYEQFEKDWLEVFPDELLNTLKQQKKKILRIPI